jgi:hypothetical protein
MDTAPVPVTAGETLRLVLSARDTGSSVTFRVSANNSGGSDLCFKLYLSP